MANVTLGSTGITVNKNGFGALPIQRISFEESGALLKKAFSAGIAYFDTARFYTDSEEKLGAALSGVRDKIYIASKSMAKTPDDLRGEFETCLANLKTSYVDVYQFHNPPFCPKPGDGSGLYEFMLESKSQGKIRHIGITSHRMDVAQEAVDSGLYEILQYPFSYLSDEKDIEMAKKCAEKNVGFVAMKPMAGGAIQCSKAAYAFIAEYPNVLPIWGVQRDYELDEFLSYMENPPSLADAGVPETIEKDRMEMAGEFCRGCAYCLPCPAGIQIDINARMYYFLRRAPVSVYTSEKMQVQMSKIEDCTKCGLCASRCPYGLDTPALLERSYKDYKEVLAGKKV